jgi:AbrB family looped-hinge helix DNA binding protein
MAGIYRSRYYTDVTVGSGGRLTIPQEIREDLGIDDGNVLTIRVEESPDGQRQMVIWKAAEQPEE